MQPIKTWVWWIIANTRNTFQSLLSISSELCVNLQFYGHDSERFKKYYIKGFEITIWNRSNGSSNAPLAFMLATVFGMVRI